MRKIAMKIRSKFSLRVLQNILSLQLDFQSAAVYQKRFYFKTYSQLYEKGFFLTFYPVNLWNAIRFPSFGIYWRHSFGKKPSSFISQLHGLWNSSPENTRGTFLRNYFEIEQLAYEETFKVFLLFSALVAILFSGAEPFYHFNRKSPKEHFCEINLKLGHWPRRRSRLKVFLFLALVVILFCNILAILVEGHPRNNSAKLFWNHNSVKLFWNQATGLGDVV